MEPRDSRNLSLSLHSGRYGAAGPGEGGHHLERQPRAAEGDPEEGRQLHLRRLQRRGRQVQQRRHARNHV